MPRYDSCDLTPDERQALDWALNLAYDDQYDYIREGKPDVDYGDEWTEAQKIKADNCRHLAEVARKYNFGAGEIDRWTDLAAEVENI